MKRETLTFILMFAPGLLAYFIIKTIPIIWAVYFGMTEWSGLSLTGEFIGLENYQDLFNDPRYIRAFWNTLYLTFGSIGLQVSMGIIFAYWTYRRGWFGRFFRSVVYFPALISFIIGGMMISWVFDPSFGIFNRLLEALGLSAYSFNWLAYPVTSMPVMLVAMLWQGFGLYVILFTVAMQSVPESIYDSAKIDGLGPVQTLFKIVIPMIKGTILVAFILIVSSAFKTFDIVYVMTGGGPGNLTEVLAFYLYQAAFDQLRAGYAAAIGTTILIVSMIIVIIYVRVSKPVVPTQKDE